VYDLTLNEYSVTCVKAEYTCQVGSFAASFLERPLQHHLVRT
jgi:hypothetical protein